ncbi:MAG: HepT-like ribonuclease domain-containing protein [Thermomicrobiales bacterium]
MTQPRTISYLGDVSRACAYVASKVETASLERYLLDEDLRFAIERNLITIGEAMVQIRDHELEALVRIPHYREAIGLRNVVVHDYRQVDDRQIWGIITEFLPELAEEVRQLVTSDD